MREINDTISSNGIVVNLDDKAVSYLAKKGCDSKMGARPIKRLLDNEVKQKIVDDMLFGELSLGGEVSFSLVGDELVKKIIRKEKPAKKDGKPSSKVVKKMKRYEKLEEEAEV